MKKLETYFNSRYSFKFTDKLLGRFEIKNKKLKEELIVDTEVVKDILRIEEVRQNYMYRRFGPKKNFTGFIYPGGFSALKDNEFKSKLNVFTAYDSMEKEDSKGVSKKSIIFSGVRVGKKRGSFQMAIFLADYLLAIEPGITVDMIQEMEDYQLSILKLNKNISEEVRLLLELK
jgi:hypothetical protein